jgi:hypothetical protein
MRSLRQVKPHLTRHRSPQGIVLPLPCRRILVLLSSISLIACMTVSVTGAWGYAHSSHVYREFGRGRVVVAFCVGRGFSDVELTRFDEPLTAYCPDATWVRMRPYGWFVGKQSVVGLESEHFSALRTEADHELRPVTFKTAWYVRGPIWCVAIATAAGPLLLVWLRFRRRRGPCNHRQTWGFDVHVIDVRRGEGCELHDSQRA